MATFRSLKTSYRSTFSLRRHFCVTLSFKMGFLGPSHWCRVLWWWGQITLFTLFLYWYFHRKIFPPSFVVSTWFYMGYIWYVIKPCHRSTPVCQGYMSLFLVYITLFSLPDYSLMLYVPPQKKIFFWKCWKGWKIWKPFYFVHLQKLKFPPYV